MTDNIYTLKKNSMNKGIKYTALEILLPHDHFMRHMWATVKRLNKKENLERKRFINTDDVLGAVDFISQESAVLIYPKKHQPLKHRIAKFILDDFESDTPSLFEPPILERYTTAYCCADTASTDQDKALAGLTRMSQEMAFLTPIYALKMACQAICFAAPGGPHEAKLFESIVLLGRSAHRKNLKGSHEILNKEVLSYRALFRNDYLGFQFKELLKFSATSHLEPQTLSHDGRKIVSPLPAPRP